MSQSVSSSRWMHGLVGQRELQLMLGMLGLIAGLLLMARLLPALGGGYVLLSWVLLWLPMLVLLFWRRRRVRGAWLRVYLKESSPWYRRLRGGALMFLGQALLSGALALALLISLARGIPPSSWIALVLFVPVWTLGWRAAWRYLDRHATQPLLPLTAASVLRWVCGTALLLVFATWALWQPYPSLDAVTLYEAVRLFAAQQEADSALLQRLLEWAAALDGARHWLAQHWLDGLPGLALQLVAWMLVLVQEWLFVWPYLLLCQALTHLIYRDGYRTDPRAAAV
jgi:hypothetical protein